MKRPLAAVTCMILAVAMATALAADKRESRAVPAFSGVALGVPAKMEIIQGGDTESLTLDGPEEILADIETVVRDDGVLAIRLRKGVSGFPHRGEVRIVATMKRVESLAIAGSGDIFAKTLRGPKLVLMISGSGNMGLPAVDTDEASVSISGSGDVRMGGRAASLSSSITGSGDLRADKLETRKASVMIAGAGDVALWVREALAVKIAGAGDVRYYGDPSIAKHIMGAGSVKRLGPSPS